VVFLADHPSTYRTAGLRRGTATSTSTSPGTTSTTPPRPRSARVCAALQYPPPVPIPGSATAIRRHPARPGAGIRALRRDRLGGFVHEYLQVA